MVALDLMRLGWRIIAALAVAVSATATQAAASPSVIVGSGGRQIIIEGLSAKERSGLLAENNAVRLSLADTPVAMPITLRSLTDGLSVVPRFPLLSGERYDLTLRLDEVVVFEDLKRSDHATAPPEVVDIFPAATVVPANILRMRVRFSRPMARGQIRRLIRLEDIDGRIVDSPFMNLDVELWNADQTVATLYLDPGRTKRGVGPNVSQGSPLSEGERYRLVVSADIESADGRALGIAYRRDFMMGPAVRRPVHIDRWQVNPVTSGTFETLTVDFPRLMDRAGVERIRVVGPGGLPHAGTARMTERRWTFTPDAPWPANDLAIAVDPAIEDVAANTVVRAFDERGRTHDVKERHVRAVPINVP